MLLHRNRSYPDGAIRLNIGCSLLHMTRLKTGLIAVRVIRYVLAPLGAVNVSPALIAHCPLPPYTLANINRPALYINECWL